jgi:hypothetical protein
LKANFCEARTGTRLRIARFGLLLAGRAAAIFGSARADALLRRAPFAPVFDEPVRRFPADADFDRVAMAASSLSTFARCSRRWARFASGRASV